MELKLSSGIIEGMENTSHALTVREVAEFFQVSDMTVYRLAKAGEIPSFRIGNSLRFDPKALANWLRTRMRAFYAA